MKSAHRRRHFGSFRSVAMLSGIAVASGLLALGVLSVTADPSPRTGTVVGSCTPAVMVVRNAEDITLEVEPFHKLSPSGSEHARLYPMLLSGFLAQSQSLGPSGASVSVCPIGKVLAIDPVGNPTAHDTIRPLAESLRLAVEVKDPMGVSYSTDYEWTIERRLALLTGGSAATTSTVIAWDGAGLNPSLLKALPITFTLEPSGEHFVPASTDFYVFAGADATTGQFSTFVAFQQEFTNDGTTWYSTKSLDPTEIPTGIRVGAPL
ncbi:MAG: hypothetical protein F2842_06245 [Actinobacteria bacterium]|uniref:Unannotated protein n=1 Tax=freshwater metagenome TaxID=449393 RepID=A0A6J7PKX4_9ZZZZ|nr:hypothetical protein [Actinomycetota bacterium]MSW41794.1 hypothetical protein [Actinomycetota bacterium]